MVRSTAKLDELCERFHSDILMRSTQARLAANIPAELTAIPDYRQLVKTSKFANFTRCTCDHASEHKHKGRAATKNDDDDDDTKGNSSTSCKKHAASRSQRRRTRRVSSVASSSKSDSGSDSSGTSSRASSLSSSSSSSSSEDEKEKKAKEEEEEQEKKHAHDQHGTAAPDDDDEFEDIRSMEIHRKQNHPERLHCDLCFNEPDQVRTNLRQLQHFSNIHFVQIRALFSHFFALHKSDFNQSEYNCLCNIFSSELKTNEGPLCKCKLKNTTFGTRHQIYFGEQVSVSI